MRGILRQLTGTPKPVAEIVGERVLSDGQVYLRDDGKEAAEKVLHAHKDHASLELAKDPFSGGSLTALKFDLDWIGRRVTSPEAMETFINSGDITDRGLEGGLNRSGWTSQQVREGLSKTYAVSLIGLSRFLYSDRGVSFLDQQTRKPVFTAPKVAAPARPREGLIVFADGTEWNPGGGKGAYQYLSGAWVKL